MKGPERTRAAALILMQYVLENDWGVDPEDKLIQQINAEVWCLMNGVEYETIPGSMLDADTRDIIQMLTPESLTPEKRLERGAFLLFTARELSCDNELADRG